MEAHERVLHELLKMGEMLLGCGAEINRVEDTMTRLGRAYGAKRVDIFVITSDIVLTVLFDDGAELTPDAGASPGSPRDGFCKAGGAQRPESEGVRRAGLGSGAARGALRHR